MAKGFNQIEGEDFNETFASYDKMTNAISIITVAIVKGFHLHQMDASHAFLHGNLMEEVYVNLCQSHIVSNKTWSTAWRNP